MLIQSISDIITNSSSEVFIVNDDKPFIFFDGNDISIRRIDIDYIKCLGLEMYNEIKEYCGFTKEYNSFCNKKSREDEWYKFVDDNMSTFKEKLIGKYELTVPDYLSEMVNYIKNNSVCHLGKY